MAVEYTIASHPTTYKGVRFRSRLEATWAVFFDLIGWRWEYEPIDLKGWVPDFLIHGRHRDALVEVKPIVARDFDTESRMRSAAGHGNYLFLCGISPIADSLVDVLRSLNSCCCCDDVIRCSWTYRNFVKINDRYDVVFRHRPYIGFVTGVDVYSSSAKVDEYVGLEVEELWAKAKNTTQWRPR